MVELGAGILIALGLLYVGRAIHHLAYSVRKVAEVIKDADYDE